MSDNRKYYYLKLKENYFDDDSMLMSGRLNQHLAQIEEAAESRVETLLDSLNEKFPAPNKEKDPLACGSTAFAE